MTEYDAALHNNKIICSVQKKLESGTANSKDLDRLVLAAGNITGECIANSLKAEFPNGQIPQEDVRRIISPILKRNHGFVSKMAALLQTQQFQKAGFGMKAGIPEYNRDREDDLVKEISDRSFIDGFFD